jgi:hypothetical protein
MVALIAPVWAKAGVSRTKIVNRAMIDGFEFFIRHLRERCSVNLYVPTLRSRLWNHNAGAMIPE